jgi:hypothetical protein
MTLSINKVILDNVSRLKKLNDLTKIIVTRKSTENYLYTVYAYTESKVQIEVKGKSQINTSEFFNPIEKQQVLIYEDGDIHQPVEKVTVVVK